MINSTIARAQVSSQLEWLTTLAIPPKEEAGLNLKNLRKVSACALTSYIITPNLPSPIGKHPPSISPAGRLEEVATECMN